VKVYEEKRKGGTLKFSKDKELALIMLTQALGTTQVLTMMTKMQIMVFTVFVMFYIPCLATIATLWREIGKKGTLVAILFTLSVAYYLESLNPCLPRDCSLPQDGVFQNARP
jgi:Fe2+ transport system protein B